MFSHTES
jgi:hypothetical protein